MPFPGQIERGATDGPPIPRPLMDIAIAAAVEWLYDTGQPELAVQHHLGPAPCVLPGWSLSIIPAAVDNLPALVVESCPHYRPGGNVEYVHNAETEHAVEQIVRTGWPDLYATSWNGDGFHTLSIGLTRPAEASLLAAVARYHKGCPVHHTVFCGSSFGEEQESCPWYAEGAAACIAPAWPTVKADR